MIILGRQSQSYSGLQGGTSMKMGNSGDAHRMELVDLDETSSGTALNTSDGSASSTKQKRRGSTSSVKYAPGSDGNPSVNIPGISEKFKGNTGSQRRTSAFVSNTSSKIDVPSDIAEGSEKKLRVPKDKNNSSSGGMLDNNTSNNGRRRSHDRTDEESVIAAKLREHVPKPTFIESTLLGESNKSTRPSRSQKIDSKDVASSSKGGGTGRRSRSSSAENENAGK